MKTLIVAALVAASLFAYQVGAHKARRGRSGVTGSGWASPGVDQPFGELVDVCQAEPNLERFFGPRPRWTR